MLARIRKATEEKDQGFTLIELLVVMIIIGILAAIAIPVFLNQRKKAVDSSIKSDLRTVAQAMETQFVDTQTYPTVAAQSGTTLTVGTDAVTLSSGNTVTVNSTATAFRVCGFNTKATANADNNAYQYSSTGGGLLAAKTTAACPAP